MLEVIFLRHICITKFHSQFVFTMHAVLAHLQTFKFSVRTIRWREWVDSLLVVRPVHCSQLESLFCSHLFILLCHWLSPGAQVAACRNLSPPYGHSTLPVRGMQWLSWHAHLVLMSRWCHLVFRHFISSAIVDCFLPESTGNFGMV